MAEKIKPDDEPSIEEILDSIRQIISEDDKAEAATAKAEPKPVQAPPAAEDDPFDAFDMDDASVEDAALDAEFDAAEDEDVFELTERIEPEEVMEPEPPPAPPPPPPAPAPAPEISVANAEEPPFVVDLIDESNKTENVSIPEPSVTPDPAVPASDDTLLTASAEAAAFSAIAELARRTAVEHNGITIEEIVRSELKPLLRGWLDKNLPVVIERLVREELERVSKRVLED